MGGVSIYLQVVEGKKIVDVSSSSAPSSSLNRINANELLVLPRSSKTLLLYHPFSILKNSKSSS